MSETDPLHVLSDFSQNERHIVIHPNDGYDIGLMTSEYDVELAYSAQGEAPVPGKIFLKNECRQGSVELSLKAAQRLGKPSQVRIGYADGRITISPA
jgi:hypothetical protein